jgi:uncharacterized membrane protein YqiK
MLFWLTLIQSFPSLENQDPLQTQQTQFSDRTDSPNYLASISPSSQPIIAQSNLLDNPIITFTGIGLIILLLAFFAIIILFKKFYKITPTNEAFVITGGFGKDKKVIRSGGCILIPGLHEYTRVPLKEISIDVERTGKLAVRTQDYLRADMRVSFFVCINPEMDDVLTAAERLSKEGKIAIQDIKNAIELRADDAIRAAAKTKSLTEIDSDKLGFAQEVLNLIGPDLKKVGLTLNSIAISEIGESDTYTNDFFDAQGVRLRTETIQKSIQQKREVELATKIEIEQKELEAEKKSRAIAKENETDRLSQELALESERSQRQREIQEAKDRESAATEQSQILRDKQVEEEKIKNKLAVEQSQIEADIALEERQKQLKVVQAKQQQEAEMAEISRQQSIEEARLKSHLAVQQRKITADIALEEEQKKLKIAQALQQQEAEMAEVKRQQLVQSSRLESQVEIAESEKLARTAQEESAIAVANKERERLLAAAEKAKAEEGVETAIALAQAERKKQMALIVTQQEAEQSKVSEQNVVEIEAYRRKRQAQAAQEAAQLEAESIRLLADANRQKALVEAEGLEAKIAAENAISDAKLKAEVIQDIAPSIVSKLPEIMTALAPQPGILGDPKVYLFPGQNGNGSGDLNKLLMSTSGLSIINALLDEGKLGMILGQVGQLLGKNITPHGSEMTQDPPSPPAPPAPPATSIKRSTASGSVASVPKKTSNQKSEKT